MKVHGIIYCAHNSVNGKCYIGQTRVGIKSRWRRHLDMARLGRDNMLIYRAIRNDAFGVVVLHQAFSQAELDEMERRAIESHDATNPTYGYNIESGSPGSVSPSQSTREKIAATMRERWKEMKRTGERLSVIPKGFKHSPETRAKMSKTRTGKPSPMLGKKHSEQRIAELRKQNEGRTRDYRGRFMS